MIRRPPRSTLFPTRRSSDLRVTAAGANLGLLAFMVLDRRVDSCRLSGKSCSKIRSEEHTSELQSQSKLVCRLLLEKKKKKQKKYIRWQSSTKNSNVILYDYL